MRYCTRCGNPVTNDTAKFCTSCGAPLQAAAAEQPPRSGPPAGHGVPPQPPQDAAPDNQSPGYQQPAQPPQNWGTPAPQGQTALPGGGQTPGVPGGQPQTGQPMQPPAYQQPQQPTAQQPRGGAASPAPAGAGLTMSAALAWDIARIVLGFLILAVAFGGSWHIVEGRDSAGPTAVAVIGLIAAMVALVVDLVLQRAVIGQDFDPIMRLGIRGVLVATLVIYSVYDLLHGEFQSVSDSDGLFGAGSQHLWPLVGSGPVLALAGAGLALIGPWKDRFSLPVALWRNIGAGVAGLAVIANGYQMIRGISAANDLFDGAAAPIGMSVTWLAMTVAAAVLAWALATGRRATWPVASLLVPSWALAFFWQTAFNTGLPDEADGMSGASQLGQLFKSFGTIGGGLLILAVVLAAAPLVASTAAQRMSSRWIDGARGLAMTVAGSCLALVALAASMMSSSSWSEGSSMDGSGGDDVDKGPLIWILIMALLVGVGAVFVWLSTRNPAGGRLVGIGWGVVAFLLVGITLLSSQSLTQMFTSDYLSLGRTSGFLPTAALVLPLVVVAALIAPKSVRDDYGSPITPAVRQRLDAAQQATAQRAQAAQEQAAQQQAAYGQQQAQQQQAQQPYVPPQQTYASQQPQTETPHRHSWAQQPAPSQQPYAAPATEPGPAAPQQEPVDSSEEATTAMELPSADPGAWTSWAQRSGQEQRPDGEPPNDQNG